MLLANATTERHLTLEQGQSEPRWSSLHTHQHGCNWEGRGSQEVGRVCREVEKLEPLLVGCRGVRALGKQFHERLTSITHDSVILLLALYIHEEWKHSSTPKSAHVHGSIIITANKPLHSHLLMSKQDHTSIPPEHHLLIKISKLLIHICWVALIWNTLDQKWFALYFFFWILEYLHIENDLSCGLNPRLLWNSFLLRIFLSQSIIIQFLYWHYYTILG